ncbi:O-antigen ligase family protein [Deinococcus aquatilis]|uniref:O-antigen ligase family protein n=1 Tax=Deinococcus aquatilis TaxID=519440 RepID=UPI0003715CC6|nr:O-antigen ligase family protein [Deinococcus aquatilis]
MPLIPGAGLLSLLALPRFRTLPPAWKVLLGVFLGLQLLAALLSPQPLVSLPLALIRGGLVVALIVTGYTLGHTRAVRPVLLGYSVVALTAFATTLALHPAAAFTTRLLHPYYTSVSLGLAGTLGLLLAVTWRSGPWVWRVMGGSLSLGMFLWSGSRGPLIALVAGLAAALVVGLRSQWKASLLALAGAAVLVLGLQSAVPGGVTSRFLENTLNGRGTFWADALTAARLHPWGGTGPYQLGPAFSTQYSDTSCQLWLPANSYGLEQGCPPALDALRGAWLIAHNTAFHLLGETGLVGLTGWLALMGALALAAWRSRDPLVNGVTWAIVAMGLVDTPTFLPNLGHAELYWLLGGVGVALAQQKAPTDAPQPAPHLSPAAPLLALALLAYFTLPLWLERVRPSVGAGVPILRALTLPTRLTAGENVTLFLKAEVPQGQFVVRGSACPVSGPCQKAFQTPLDASQSGWKRVTMKGLPAGRYRLSIQLSDQRARLSVEQPVAQLVRVIDVE